MTNERLEPWESEIEAFLNRILNRNEAVESFQSSGGPTAFDDVMTCNKFLLEINDLVKMFNFLIRKAMILAQ